MNTATITSQMTPKQFEFASKLLFEARTLLEQKDILTGGMQAEEIIAQHVTPLMDELLGVVSKRRASQIIGQALGNNEILRKEISGLGQVPAGAAPATTQVFVTTGMYRVGEDVYKVLPSRQSDRHYAKKLVDIHWENGQPVADHEGTLKFAYAKGAMRLIRPEHRMTSEQEREFGKLISHCVDCGKLLTHPKSIDYGKGPVCSDNYKH